MVQMKPNQFLGIVKFFRSEHEEYLDSLISGLFHCQTPETYRMSGLEGVSDKFESCAFSYRADRGDEPVSLTINDMEINDAIAITGHNGGQSDSWLNCWMSLRLPENNTELESLKEGIKLMKGQFGYHYAYILPNDLPKLIERLKQHSPKGLSCGEVVYKEDKNEWGAFCKSPSYAYQREYRFSFGTCSPLEKEPYCFRCPEGLQDLIHKNPELKIESKDGKYTWFDLTE